MTVAVEKERGAVVAAPGVVARYHMQADVAHVGVYRFELGAHMRQHHLVIDVDVHRLAFGDSLHEEVVRRIDSLNLARPRVWVLRVGEPRGLVPCPFCGHVVALFFGGH